MAKAVRTLLTSDLALIVGGGLAPLPWQLAAICQDPNVEADQPLDQVWFHFTFKALGF